MAEVDASGVRRDREPRRESTAYPNIVWLLTDSIRNYPGEDGDIRAKLPFMELFGRDAVEFTTCVTTAPSTIMSVTAMMTGLPAYFLARNYENFRFDSGYGHSLAGVLKDHGYSSWAFLRGMETREKFSTFLDPVPRRYWPKDLRHDRKWQNVDLDRVLDRVLDAGIPRPAFLFFHYNPRSEAGTDYHLSERVELTLERLATAGFAPDNTIYILCSDHGYPASSTGITTEWEIQSRITHDVVLSDDNILIPLYIQYPGCSPARINTPVSSLDLFPTLLALADIPTRESIENEIDGVSLVPMIEGRGRKPYPRRFFRCDSRLMVQTARSTAIRSREFKYIRFHDQYRFAPASLLESAAEVLIDLQKDPRETRNLLAADAPPSDVESTLAEMRSEFERSEQRGVEFQVDYLLWRQQRKLNKGALSRDGLRVLLAFEPDVAAYLHIGMEVINRVHPGAEIHLLTHESDLSGDEFPRANRHIRYGRSASGRLEAPDMRRSATSARGNMPYDLALVFVRDLKDPGVSELLRVVKSVRSRRRLVVDCNFSAHQGSGYWVFRVRGFLNRFSHMISEPRMFLTQPKIVWQLVRRRILMRLGRWERWEATGARSVKDED